MALLGQSLYPSLGVAEAAQHLQQAQRQGCRHLFTSLHLPEASADDWASLQQLLKQAAAQGMRVTADVSPLAFERFGATPDNIEPLLALGIHALRLDYGFTLQEMQAIARHDGVSLVINASTVSEKQLAEWQENGLPLANVTAIHNFYPRPETGLSLDFYRKKSRLCRAYGLRVGSFLPAHRVPRGPVFAGLPSVEAHRYTPTAVAVAELLADGLTDIVYFGDPAPGKSEWEAAAQVAAGVIPLRVEWSADVPPAARQLMEQTHVQRSDVSGCVVRSETSRTYAQANGLQIKPFHAAARPKGTVTIDNETYGRYAGELQIARTDLPADSRVNVVGRVVAADRPLLSFIGPNTSFVFATEGEGDA
ncbi:MupG family TIM beta-alpha barrel fold protein [Numidum massiliense]|uniref:MupG family TIM beta-alpha barrel fold protein n=1 Tax=Numidum massiliense TaxID=1522315 RepID=UPI0006D59E02|nr:MupG family TIM beta-alpha barrel fold protein [Numidum massiliense]